MTDNTFLGKIGATLKNAGNALPNFHLGDESSGPIFITSANGPVAYRIACRLLAAGYPQVRVGVPDPSSVPLLAEAGAQVVEFDWDKESTYDLAVAGVKSVFCAMPHHSNWKHQFTTFFQTCKSAGVTHFVKLSFTHALTAAAASMNNFATAHRNDDPFHKVPLVAMHRECDIHVMRSPKLDYAILFASHFMSNPLVYQSESLSKENKFYGASGGKGVNYVSPNDVAEVAVRCLLAPKDHYRVGYNLTGPTAIKDTEVAELLSNKLGKTVEYVDQPLETYAGVATSTDWGPSMDVAMLEYVKAQGVEEQVGFVSHDITKVCGRPAESYDDYLQAQDLMTPQELEYLKPSMSAGGMASDASMGVAGVSSQHEA